MGMRFATLRGMPELADTSDQDLWSLLSFADELRLHAGATVAEAGRYCSELIVVMQGTLRAMSNGTARRIGPGDSLGWTAMWDRTINEATVVAESDVRLLVVGHAQFRAFKAVASYQPLEMASGFSRMNLASVAGATGLRPVATLPLRLHAWLGFRFPIKSHPHTGMGAAPAAEPHAR